MLENAVTITSFVIGMVSLIIGILATWNLRQQLSMRQRDLSHRMLAEQAAVLQFSDELKVQDIKSKRLEEIIEEKKRKFLGIPGIAFHFVNAEQVKSFYNDYFREPTVESLISEIVGETSGEIKGGIPKVAESQLGVKDSSKLVSTTKLPDTSLSGMFQRYQREIIEKEQVALGIEEVDIELTQLQAFDDAVEELNNQFGLRLDKDILDKHKIHLKEKAAERTLIKLEQATGWVLIEGRFKIEEDKDSYRCTYSHPVSEYLSEQVGPVIISVLIPKHSLEPHIAGNYAQSIGRLIRVRFI